MRCFRDTYTNGEKAENDWILAEKILNHDLRKNMQPMREHKTITSSLGVKLTCFLTSVPHSKTLTSLRMGSENAPHPSSAQYDGMSLYCLLCLLPYWLQCSISVSWFCDHRACISLGGRIGTNTECPGCRRVERTVYRGEHTRTSTSSMCFLFLSFIAYQLSMEKTTK